MKVEEGLNPEALTQILELKYLDYLGVSPSLDACANCGSTENIISLSPTEGGYVCKNCFQNERIVSEKTIKMIRLYYYVDLSKITKLDVKKEITNEINTFLDEYYEKYTGLYLKSKNFLKEINRLN